MVVSPSSPRVFDIEVRLSDPFKEDVRDKGLELGLELGGDGGRDRIPAGITGFTLRFNFDILREPGADGVQ